PGRAGRGMAARIAVAVAIAEPAPLAGIGHLDTKRPAVGHDRRDERSEAGDVVARRDEPRLGGAIEEAPQQQEAVHLVTGGEHAPRGCLGPWAMSTRDWRTRCVGVARNMQLKIAGHRPRL